MSAVRIHTPDVNLAKLIRKPGGKAVADALSGASEGLKQMSGSVVSELKATLAAAETCLAANPTGAAVEELYLIVARPIGAASLCGLAAADEVLTSLATLLDAMREEVPWALEPVTLHLHGLGLLLSAPEDSDETKALVDGLKKVTKRYAGEVAG